MLPFRSASGGGREADGLLSSFSLAQARRHPGISDSEKLARVRRRGDCIRLGLRKGVDRSAQVWLPLQLIQQAVGPSVVVAPGEPLQQGDQSGTVNLLPQPTRGRLFEVVRLVDDKVIELRKQAASCLDVGQQQCVVDHDKVGCLGLRTGAVDIAVLLGAVDADAVERIARDAVPQDLLSAMQPKLGAVAALRRVEPDENLELEHQLFRVFARLAQVTPPAPQRHVVGPAFQQACLEVPWQPLAQAGQVLAHQLFLQRVSVGRDDDPLPVPDGPRERRHEVGQALPRPGPGFNHQRAAARLDLRDGEQHLHLWLSVLVARQEVGERTFRAEQPHEDEGVFGRRDG